jgi:DNA excision repair protein ERCC-3
MDYAIAPKREKFRIASENPEKLLALLALLKKHAGSHILIIGQYLDQLKLIARIIDAPIITGASVSLAREKLYGDFREGRVPILVVSKVANYAIDLPDANVAIEVSGTFGSRQEEAQRLGRILRPKEGENAAYFYALVTVETTEEDFSAHRQLFLIEQGYPYTILEADDVIEEESLDEDELRGSLDKIRELYAAMELAGAKPGKGGSAKSGGRKRSEAPADGEYDS